MICPRCSLAEIADTGHCALCGFSPSTNVILKQSEVEEVRAIVEQATGGRFKVESLLRLGERSLVYLANEPAYDRAVALKVIPVAEGVGVELAQRFQRQAALSQRLQHAHIVPVWAFGTTHTFLWYAMEYVRGQTLADMLRESGPLSLERGLGIAEQIAGALDYAHRHGVVHGDLKPNNVLFDDRWIRVSDFAILGAFGRQPTSGASGPVLHMPEYMAPEQFYARTPGAAADQYALAILVYQCLSGTLPFIGDSFEEVARRQANDRPQPLTEHRRDIPLPMNEVLARALSKQPGERYNSVLEFVTALAAAVSSPPPAPVAPARPSPPGRRSSASATPVLVVEQESSTRWRRWLVLLTLLAVAAAAGFLFIPRPAPGPLDLTLQPSDVLPPDAALPRPTPEVAPSGERTQRAAPPPARPAPRPATPRSAAGQAAAPSAASQQPGMLFINATPWGQLYVDDRLVGNTPRGNLPVPPGQHVVRVEREGFEPAERVITVGPGEVVRITDIVLRPKAQ